jgi:hypothetical protein
MAPSLADQHELADCCVVTASGESLSTERLISLLNEVVAMGAPAQRDYALELLESLDGGVRSGDLVNAARELFDAFRNDPYLWK